jgi:predicted RNase H-like HicB family nuclease
MFQYSIILQWSEEDECYVAVVPELPGVNAFGDTPEEASAEVKVAATLYLDFLKDKRKEPPQPSLLVENSGQLRLRMPKSLHARLVLQAHMEGVSLNSYIVHLLSSGAEKEEKYHKTAKAAYG